jgi:hypothetical protein
MAVFFKVTFTTSTGAPVGQDEQVPNYVQSNDWFVRIRHEMNANWMFDDIDNVTKLGKAFATETDLNNFIADYSLKDASIISDIREYYTARGYIYSEEVIDLAEGQSPDINLTGGRSIGAKLLAI